jgi:hypothetical protein
MSKAKSAIIATPTLEVCRDANGKIFSPIRKKWLIETPEERVRQEYVCALVNEYDFPPSRWLKS